jgi:hypothetical protein
VTEPRVRSAGSSSYLAQVIVVAALLTSAFMLMTAAELGPMGPLVIAEGFYLAGFALMVELGMLAGSACKLAVAAIETRRADVLETEK